MSETQYAKCLTCGIDLETPQDKDRHVKETMAPVAEPKWENHRASHSYRVLNPTPEERAQRAIDLAVEDALVRFCDDLDSDLHRAKYTKEDVTRALRSYPDFGDAWENYLAEGADQ